MANLKEIRNRIKSIKSIQKVTSAMKMVAAAKLRTSQNNMERCRPYSQKISHLINDMLVEVEKTNFGLMEKRNIKTTLYVVITSDRGMAGAFNTNIIKTAQNQIDLDQSNKSKIICIGKKSRDYFKNKNYEVISEYLDFWADLNFKNAINIGNQISDLFLNKDVDCVKVFYNEFKNLGSQTIKNVKFLPLEENVDTKKTIVAVNPIYYRPTEVDTLLGDSTKAREVLGWKPEIEFEDLVKDMCLHGT